MQVGVHERTMPLPRPDGADHHYHCRYSYPLEKTADCLQDTCLSQSLDRVGRYLRDQDRRPWIHFVVGMAFAAEIVAQAGVGIDAGAATEVWGYQGHDLVPERKVVAMVVLVRERRSCEGVIVGSQSQKGE